MRYFPLLLIFLVAAACNSSRKQNEELLLRKWQYDLEAIRSDLYQTPVSDRQVNYVDGVMDRLKFATLEFKPEGKLTLNLNNQDMPGTWELNSRGDEITINLSGIPQTSVILELTEDRLVMRQKVETDLNFNRIMVPAETASGE